MALTVSAASIKAQPVSAGLSRIPLRTVRINKDAANGGLFMMAQILVSMQHSKSYLLFIDDHY